MTAVSKKKKSKRTYELQKIKVAIMTPYLTESFDQDCDQDYVQKQITKFGYDPANFTGVQSLSAGRFQVLLETSEKHTVACPHLTNFAIAGSTENMEEIIKKSMGSGLIVARYSTFYGGCSRYTGNSPEEGGYALDIPKQVSIVRAFLASDSVLDALVSRNEEKIHVALDAFNKKISQPVLITPYLKEALKLAPSCNSSLETCTRGS